MKFSKVMNIINSRLSSICNEIEFAKVTVSNKEIELNNAKEFLKNLEENQEELEQFLLYNTKIGE